MCVDKDGSYGAKYSCAQASHLGTNGIIYSESHEAVRYNLKVFQKTQAAAELTDDRASNPATNPSNSFYNHIPSVKNWKEVIGHWTAGCL